MNLQKPSDVLKDYVCNFADAYKERALKGVFFEDVNSFVLHRIHHYWSTHSQGYMINIAFMRTLFSN